MPWDSLAMNLLAVFGQDNAQKIGGIWAADKLVHDMLERLQAYIVLVKQKYMTLLKHIWSQAELGSHWTLDVAIVTVGVANGLLGARQPMQWPRDSGATKTT